MELLYQTFYHQLPLKIPDDAADSSDQDSKVRHHLKTFLFSLPSLQRRTCLKEENQTARKRRGEDTREDRWIQKEHLIPDKFKMLTCSFHDCSQDKKHQLTDGDALCY